MQGKYKDATWLEVFSNAIQMRQRGLLCFKMPKGVDCIDGCIKGLIERKVGHVTNDKLPCGFFLFEFLFAVLKCGRVQVKTGHRVTAFRHIAYQSS